MFVRIMTRIFVFTQNAEFSFSCAWKNLFHFYTVRLVCRRGCGEGCRGFFFLFRVLASIADVQERASRGIHNAFFVDLFVFLRCVPE